MAYSGDPSASTIDAIRFYLGGSISDALLSDAEIQYFISTNASYSTDPMLLAAALCTNIMSKFAGEVAITGDGITYSGDQIQEKYAALAESLREQWQRQNGSKGAPYAGGIDRCEWTDPTTRAPLFALGRNDDPYGPNQLEERNHGELWDDGNYQANT
jgi:hypothetical protein